MLDSVISVRVAMSDAKIERKIAVIFATDVVGYSKHMEADENETIHSLRACEEILQKLFAKYDGRLFNTGGDSFLAEFSSAVSAVECAVEFQKAIQTRNSSGGTNTKLEFRIGINSGDVVKEKDNLLGDGVNIAARLEALAQTNGVIISKSVYDFIRGKTNHEFIDQGIQKVKQNEFHAFDLLLDPSQKRKISSAKHFSKTKIATLGLIALGLIAAIFLSNVILERPKKYTSEQEYTEIVASSLPVILVYPFKNLSTSAEGENSSAAITESMIASLSQFVGISVLSSSTSIDAKETELSDSEIKERYKANYIVRGSIQSFGNQSRVNLELTDLALNKVVWSDKATFSQDDIFKVQDEIGDKILTYLQISAVTGAQGQTWASKFGNLQRLTKVLNGRNEWRKGTIDGYNKFMTILEELESEMGENSPALANIQGWGVFLKLQLGLTENKDADLAQLDYISKKDIEKNNDVDAYALRALSELFFLSKDCELAQKFIKDALNLGRSGDAYTIAGAISFRCSDLDAAIESYRNALDIIPNDNGWFISKSLIAALYLVNDFEGIEEIMKQNKDSTDIDPTMLAVYAFVKLNNGDMNEAKSLFTDAKKRGLNEKSLIGNLRSKTAAVKLMQRLEPLGSIN